MPDRYMQLRCGKCSCTDGIGVPLYKDDARGMFKENFLNTRKNCCGLGTMVPGSDIEVVGRESAVELFEENLVHGVGIMLSGMQHGIFKTVI